MIRRNFDAEVDRAGGQMDALASLKSGQFDLVLVNRRLVGDGSEGVELIREIKADPQLASTPVMLLSDYAQYQEKAVAAGAESGFGKSQLADPEALARLAQFLA